jgi:hypothetical protein
MTPVPNPKCPDFEYLCQAAERAGWLVGISASKDFIDKPRDGHPGRRMLGSIRLKRNASAPAKIAVPIEGNLALASRIALDQLLAQAKNA